MTFEERHTPREDVSARPDSEGVAANARYVDPTLTREAELFRVHEHLATARQADELLDGGVTKRFVMEFGGTTCFPFRHARMRFTPNSRTPSQDIAVAAVRIPTETPETVFVSWALTDGTESTFVLDVGQFSRADLATVFSRIGEGVLVNREALSPPTEDDLGRLLVVLHSFEPDLQTTHVNLTH